MLHASKYNQRDSQLNRQDKKEEGVKFLTSIASVMKLMPLKATL